jgi:hypothetical protein
VSSVTYWDAICVAEQTDGAANNYAVIHLRGIVQRVGSASAADVGGLLEEVIGRSDTALGVDLRCASGNLHVYVTGSASKTYKWSVTLNTTTLAA